MTIVALLTTGSLGQSHCPGHDLTTKKMLSRINKMNSYTETDETSVDASGNNWLIISSKTSKIRCLSKKSF